MDLRHVLLFLIALIAPSRTGLRIAARKGNDEPALVAHRRHRRLFLFLIVFVLIAVSVVIGCSKGAPADDADFGGLIWVEDDWIESPFVFEVSDFQIRIDHRIAKEFLPLTPETDPPPIPQSPENMSDLLEVAAQKFRDLGRVDVVMPSEAVISELTTFVKSLQMLPR